MIVINGSVSDEVKALLLAGKSHPSARIHGNLIIPGGSGGGGKTYADMLYEHFEIDKVEYPYLTILYYTTGTYRVFFTKGISADGTLYTSRRLNEDLRGVDPTDVGSVVNHASDNYTKDNLDTVTAYVADDRRDANYYVNYDMASMCGFTKSVIYRLDQ